MDGHEVTDGAFSTCGARFHLIGPSEPGQSGMGSSAHVGDVRLFGDVLVPSLCPLEGMYVIKTKGSVCPCVC